MLGKSKSRGSLGFTAGLVVANMRLSGMRRVGILSMSNLFFPALFLLIMKNKYMLGFREDLFSAVR